MISKGEINIKFITIQCSKSHKNVLFFLELGNTRPTRREREREPVKIIQVVSRHSCHRLINVYARAQTQSSGFLRYLRKNSPWECTIGNHALTSGPSPRTIPSQYGQWGNSGFSDHSLLCQPLNTFSPREKLQRCNEKISTEQG